MRSEMSKNKQKLNIIIWFILNEFKNTWSIDIIFPIEIIIYIMKIIIPPIHPKNICPCDEKECLEKWNESIGKKQLFYYKKIHHCRGNVITVGNNYKCHKILTNKILTNKINEYRGYKCILCRRYFCNGCGQHYNDIDYTDDDQKWIAILFKDNLKTVHRAKFSNFKNLGNFECYDCGWCFINLTPRDLHGSIRWRPLN